MNTVVYWLFLAIINKFQDQEKNQKVNPKGYPFVSFIIPTYNEEANIERKIDSLIDLNYPKSHMEIIVVDDGSTDNTVNIIREIQGKIQDSCSLQMIQLQHKGPANALHTGSCSARGDIIVWTDADAFLQNEDAIQIATHRLSDTSIGAVFGIASEKARKSYDKYERSLFIDIQKLEGELDSAIDTNGTFFAFRKKFIELIKINRINYDANLAMEIRKNGFKVLVEPKISLTHSFPKSIKSYLHRRMRMFVGCLEMLFSHYHILFNRKYGYYGMVIAPRDLLFRSIEPLVFVAMSIKIVHILVVNNMILTLLKSLLLFSVILFFLAIVFKTRIYTLIREIIHQVLTFFAKFIGYFVFISYIYHRDIDNVWKSRE
jgi:cellulose synthase/poly-beta-1,6-N-acetylglucosamine synthase-like glycosyltransferase